MANAMEVVLEELLKEVGDSTLPETSYSKMGLNCQKVQSSLKGWCTKILQREPAITNSTLLKLDELIK